jgi:outer membrane protein OmpA-like peptidoglycan-associated protein
MRKFVIVAPLIAVAFASSTACATKKYVNESVSQVNDKVNAVSKSLEETQERTRQNEAKIQQVDEKYGKQVAAVDGKATAAGQSAANAQSTAERAILKAEEVDKASKRLVYEVTLSEASGSFKFNQTDLPDEAKAQIDRLIEQLKADPNKGSFIEIEGHTDNVGEQIVNERVGLERAEAVKRYLYEKHQVPLHKMNVISYGEEKPAAPNNTRDGRAQNRRVVIRVLA